MTQRIICPETCSSQQSGKPIEFNVKDDFKIKYTFTNKNFNPPILIPLDTFDVTIDYFIKGRAERYTVEKKGMITKNCILYPKFSAIKSVFDNHGLKPGYLYAEFTFRYYDPEYPDRMGESIVTQFTNIILKETAY